MTTYAQLSADGKTVENVVVADAEFAAAQGLVELAGVGVGWTNDGTGTGWVPPPIPVTVTNQQAITQTITAALDANVAFLANVTPTTAEVTAQVEILTQQVVALVRLALGLLDSTAGT